MNLIKNLLNLFLNFPLQKMSKPQRRFIHARFSFQTHHYPNRE
jgi:hypothetical protein